MWPIWEWFVDADSYAVWADRSAHCLRNGFEALDAGGAATIDAANDRPLPGRQVRVAMPATGERRYATGQAMATAGPEASGFGRSLGRSIALCIFLPVPK
jgi:hypothetical protein